MLAAKPRVTAIATSDYPTRAVRPAWSCLDTAALVSVFGIELPRWEDELGRVLDGLVEAAA